MPFSKEDKALTTHLYQFKKNGSPRIVTEFAKINCKTEESILNGLSAIHSWNVYRSLKSHEKIKVINVGTTRKLMSSAFYDKQQVCVYL